MRRELSTTRFVLRRTNCRLEVRVVGEDCVETGNQNKTIKLHNRRVVKGRTKNTCRRGNYVNTSSSIVRDSNPLVLTFPFC